MSVLTIQDLSFAYGKRLVLKNLSLTLSAGSAAALLGQSGQGKTTLFRCIAGLLKPSQGSIRAAPTALMMQQDLLLPWRTVLQNILLGCELEPTHAPGCTICRQRTEELLKDVDLLHWQNAYPHMLSGGMRQRVALARALLIPRPLLLMDEPFGALDLVLREQMAQLIRKLQKKYGFTLFFITHDLSDALQLAHEVHLLQNGTITWSEKIEPTASLSSEIALRHKLREQWINAESAAAQTAPTAHWPSAAH